MDCSPIAIEPTSPRLRRPPGAEPQVRVMPRLRALGAHAAPVSGCFDGDIHGRCGHWTESQWRPAACGCGAEALPADHAIGDLDFADGAPGPVGCRCHEAFEDRAGWLAWGDPEPEDGTPWSFDEGVLRPTTSWRRDQSGTRGGNGASAMADPAYVDIYFSAGERKNWPRIGHDLENLKHLDEQEPQEFSYRSCDDGNDRSCEIWRVRWYFGSGRATATAVKVIGREDFGVEDWYPIGLTRPAVSPDGRYLAYGYREWTSRNTLSEAETTTQRVAELGGPHSADNEVAWPLPWGGGVGWGSWMDDDTLVVGNEKLLGRGDTYWFPDAQHPALAAKWTAFNASFKTVQKVPLKEATLGKEANGDPMPLRGPGVFYSDYLYYPNKLVSLALNEVGVATDPHAHPDADYGEGGRRGPRVASFGNRHNEELGDAATTVVFDPELDDPFGEMAETFRKPVETYGDGKEVTVEGLHHPTWNISGNMVQCSHQQGSVPVDKWVGRRSIHGFRWSEDDGEWVPWNNGTGRLFPNGGWDEKYNSDAWWEGLPETLFAGSDGFPDFPAPVGSDTEKDEERCAMYVWKYAAFCGSDDYVVAQLACVNPEWATKQFRSKIDGTPSPDLYEEAVEHLAQLASRVVLIRLSDGFHWDVTSVVEDALAEAAGPLSPTATLFGLYPTCGAIRGLLPDQD